MKLFNKVAIIGVGLIGGSLASDIKKKNLANQIIGIARHKKTLSLAKKKRIIDYASQDIGKVCGADLVILSVPVNAILKLAPVISRIIGPDCIVCDVGSTKGQIVYKLDRIFPNYLGTHPLAGSEKQGVINSRPGIFKGSFCILTPTKNTSSAALLKVKKLWSCVGAKVISMPCDIHDKILSFTSHLPHIAAFSLMDVMPEEYLKFASSGLKDTTRIAASDAELWNDIFLSNQKNIIRAIDLLQNKLSGIKSAIVKRDAKALKKILSQAKIKRDNLD